MRDSIAIHVFSEKAKAVHAELRKGVMGCDASMSGTIHLDIRDGDRWGIIAWVSEQWITPHQVVPGQGRQDSSADAFHWAPTVQQMGGKGRIGFP
jgi:hypothetical protein